MFQDSKYVPDPCGLLGDVAEREPFTLRHLGHVFPGLDLCCRYINPGQHLVSVRIQMINVHKICLFLTYLQMNCICR